MKELWKSNPFHLMNSPFTEMGYNSCVPNIVPERLLLATRRPSTHHPLASGAASFDPLRATCRSRHLPTRHKPSATHGATSGDPPPQAICRRSAQHLATPCTASAISLRAILWPLRSIRRLPASHLPASSPRDTRQPIASHPSSHGAASASPSQTIRHLAARHPLAPCRQSAGTNRCP